MGQCKEDEAGEGKGNEIGKGNVLETTARAMGKANIERAITLIHSPVDTYE